MLNKTLANAWQYTDDLLRLSLLFAPATPPLVVLRKEKVTKPVSHLRQEGGKIKAGEKGDSLCNLRAMGWTKKMRIATPARMHNVETQ